MTTLKVKKPDGTWGVVSGGGDTSAITTPAAGVGLDYCIAYSDAAALVTRPTLPTGAKLRIYGGTTSDTDPEWMADGDYRDIVVS